ncbi:uncharacterized protein C56G2.4-like [Haliotis cracherodii]|uniref:uncharacterized protein C56G2.4-like n=1 Tax=Haliotis cracherodii TaxID=6455 RepID=UPI0039E91DB9
MAPLLVIVVLQIVVFHGISSQTVCSVDHDAACVAAVTSLYTNASAYWFGSAYATACPANLQDTLLCMNAKRSRTSLLTRLMGDAATDTSGFSFVVNVTYSTSPGTYEGCGRKVTIPMTTQRTFSIDPLDDHVYAPFDLREQPEVTWVADENALYTVVLYDAGIFFTHALYVNVAGGRLQGGETIKSYFGPASPVDRVNPYVWIVLEQPTSLNATDVRAFYNNHTAANKGSMYLDMLVTRFNLSGSYGFNVVKVTNDEYAAVLVRGMKFHNRCPHYYGQWLDDYIGQRGGLPSLIPPFDLSISVDVTFTASSITYEACCTEEKNGPVNVTLDYRNSGTLKTVVTRNTPNIKLVPTEILQAPANTLKDKQYTLIMYDPTPELNKTKQNSYVHWMIVNIRGTNITSGDEVYDWLLPMTSTLTQLYLFALFEQTTSVNVSSAKSYSRDGCHEFVSNRCDYRAGDFIRANQLSLVGLRFLKIVPGTYRQFISYSEAKLQSMDDACKGTQGYANPCPTSASEKMTSSAIFISLLTAAVAYMSKRK